MHLQPSAGLTDSHSVCIPDHDFLQLVMSCRPVLHHFRRWWTILFDLGNVSDCNCLEDAHQCRGSHLVQQALRRSWSNPSDDVPGRVLRYLANSWRTTILYTGSLNRTLATIPLIFGRLGCPGSRSLHRCWLCRQQCRHCGVVCRAHPPRFRMALMVDLARLFRLPDCATPSQPYAELAAGDE